MHKPQLNPFGQFPGQALVGFFNDGFENCDPNRSVLGARLTAVAPNCGLIDADGNLWNIARYAAPGKTLGFRILTNIDGQPFHTRHPSSTNAFSGPVSFDLSDQAHTISSEGDPGTSAVFVQRTRDTIRWTEAGIFDLTGSRVCPPMSALMPSARGLWGFSSCIARVSGTLLGRSVNGFVEHPSLWASGDADFGQLHDENTAIWMIVCNEYDDGAYDFIHLAAMRDGTRFALLADQDGPLIATNDVLFRATVDSRGFPDRIDIDIEGQPWVWMPCINADISDPAGPLKRDREGICRRVGDARTPRLTFGWVNFFNDERMTQYLRVP